MEFPEHFLKQLVESYLSVNDASVRLHNILAMQENSDQHQSVNEGTLWIIL